MQNLDLTASKWASPDVRRERASQTQAWTRRTPSPRKVPWQQQPQQPQQEQQQQQLPLPTATPLSEPASSAQQRRYLTRQAELQRFRRLFRRLAWKANSLTHWSHRALSLAQEHQSQRQQQQQQQQHTNGSLGDEEWVASGPQATLGPYDLIIDPVDAERQFKIDFYEFYTLLERGLVCLLGVWGIVITASATAGVRTADNDGNDDDDKTGMASKPHVAHGRTPPLSKPIIGDSLSFQGAAHRFHANVLAALDHAANPLHGVLGTGPARAYIGVAKEFRNKWKDVESRPADSFRGAARVEEEWDPAKVRRYEEVLRDLKLEALLGTVLRALEEAGRMAEREIARLEASLGAGGRGAEAGAGDRGERMAPHRRDVDWDMQDAPFEVLDRPNDADYEMEF
ncbi:hypothetical protein AYL99_05339 [Fonsecaea erecta]|uniref:Uncharacterized protein n=1 Tax=Fonsecaea erecta TaxID=1367422 RepID=A0A178ZKM2_9EURO|nr:hypothetical protein AYL99_05339 [Fonsecaea erecta]OAP60337.1 hypothetical protein AYL99_05339 [Fonsecaea erecta]